MAGERDILYLPLLGMRRPSRDAVGEQMSQVRSRAAFPVLLVGLVICGAGYVGVALLLASGLIAALG